MNIVHFFLLDPNTSYNSRYFIIFSSTDTLLVEQRAAGNDVTRPEVVHLQRPSQFPVQQTIDWSIAS
jgi:hypothetical protein